MINKIKTFYSYIQYTWEHYKALLKTEKKYIGKRKHIFHDWDKLVMYALIPFVGEEKINCWHQRFNKHHPVYWTVKNGKWESHNKPPNEVNWEEAIMDWECAPLTKPDKPLNARDTGEKYYPQYMEYIEEELSKFNL